MNDQVEEVLKGRVFEKKEWNSAEAYLHFLRHMKAYQFASTYCEKINILDYGCGSGYGTSFLSKYANKVIGVDISGEVIDHCTRTYNLPNTLFQIIFPDCSLPFEDKVFDVIVSFQVIEHVSDVRRFLSELRRMLKDNGVLIITTPNRKHRLLPFQKPWNPDHIREYSLRYFIDTLNTIFDKVKIMGVYGTQEINEIEYRRVKQSPFRIYLYKPCVRLIRSILPISMFSFLRDIKQKASSNGKSLTESAVGIDLPSKYSIDDFTVGDNLDICIDFVAVCHKAQAN